MPTGRWLLAAVCLTALSACGRQGRAHFAGTAMEPVEVVGAYPTRKTIHYTVEQPGQIEPFEQTPIYAKIAGYVAAVHVEIGSCVKRGDLLAELRVPELVEEHRRKEALVVQAQLGITQAERSVKVVEKGLDLARAEIDVARAAQEKAEALLKRWESEFERMDRLVQQNVLDKQSRDEVRNQTSAASAAKAEAAARLRSAEASLAETRARRDKALTDLDASHNHLLVAEADERQFQEMLKYTRITAPFDGVVADRRVHTGHFLQAAAGGTKGEPLFVVVRTDKVRVFFEVPEADAIRVKQGSPGRIRVQVLNDQEFEGEVAGTSWSLNPSQRTLRTEIDFTNVHGLFRPGMYVHALIDVERVGAWVVPTEAVLLRDGVSFCYLVQDGKTHRLPLRVGLRDRSVLEILKFQQPSRRQGEQHRWVNPSGQELIVACRPGELIDNQSVHVAEANAE